MSAANTPQDVVAFLGGIAGQLAEQMGTSVKMIENHYGHVNTIKHADRVLMGIGGWEAMHVEMDAEDAAEEATAKARQAAKSNQSIRPSHFKR